MESVFLSRRKILTYTISALALMAGATHADDAPLIPPPNANTSPALISPLSPELSAKMAKIKQDTLKHMVKFKAGSFQMGNPGFYGFDSADTRPLHKVTLDGFSMMAYKVSYEEFDVFTDSVGEQRVNMDEFSQRYRAPRKPAGVSWYGAKAYCQWLGKLTGKPFDLPTEAQWEYAARSGGKRVLFATDNGKVEEGRNYPDSWSLKGADAGVTPDIGKYPPNPAGLYGMIDYVSAEWVQDWYDPTYYQRSPERNPKGGAEKDSFDTEHPEFGPRKVLRGDPNGNNPALASYVFTRGRSGLKYDPEPGYSYYAGTQFRCVINAAPPSRLR